MWKFHEKEKYSFIFNLLFVKWTFIYTCYTCQIPVVSVTGRAPGRPGMYKYYTPERQWVTCVTKFWILIISIHTSRFGNRIKQIWQPLLFINGYLRMEYTSRFCPQNPAPGAADRPQGHAQSGRTPEFGYGPLVYGYWHYEGYFNHIF